MLKKIMTTLNGALYIFYKVKTLFYIYINYFQELYIEEK